MEGLRLGVIGCGYWGPNLIRNFAENEGVVVRALCDLKADRLQAQCRRAPGARLTTDPEEVLKDPRIDAVVIATPVATHHALAQKALETGKHVFLEKPMARSGGEAETLIALAERRGLVLFVDHVFIYTGAVRKIRELIGRNDLGEILYYDSVRVNLGLFQSDINVLWDLAPHDLSIMDFVLGRIPTSVSAVGSCHVVGTVEDIVYLTLTFEDNLIAHFHLNWLSPVKIRLTLIGGDQRMLVYDDLEPSEKVRVYDRGVTLNHSTESLYRSLVEYRIGDMWAPRVDLTEALKLACQEFVDSVREKRKPSSDGEAGLRVVRILEAADLSLKQDGRRIRIPWA